MDDAGAGASGLSGQFVRSRTDRDARLYLEEQRARGGGGRLRPMGRVERRLFWLATGLVVALGIAHRLGA